MSFSSDHSGSVSSGDGRGFWFTRSKNYAFEYAENAAGVRGGDPRIVTARLTFNKPLVVRFNDDGAPDEEHQPKTINSLIRQILHSFSRKAYVGYTATPFANIYIHHKGATTLEGPDLFPKAFIINLAAPSNYVGPARMFGKLTKDGRVGALPLSRTPTAYLVPVGEDRMRVPGSADKVVSWQVADQTVPAPYAIGSRASSGSSQNACQANAGSVGNRLPPTSSSPARIACSILRLPPSSNWMLTLG